jgi:hypothetical protein
MSSSLEAFRVQELNETAEEFRLRMDYLAGFVKELETSRFVQLGNVWVYPEPLQTQRALGFFTDEKKVLVHLNFPEQFILLESLVEKFGFKPRFGSLEENFAAAYTREAAGYRDRVLEGFFVFTGELAVKTAVEAEVRKVAGVKIVDKNVADAPDQVIVNVKRKPHGVAGTRRLQVEYVVDKTVTRILPEEEGFFEDFKVVPSHADLKLSGKGYVYKSFFDAEGFAAYQCFWFNKKKVFGVHACEPLTRSNGVAVPVWTSENPKK